jgi:predicted transposase/invertase (TIGR01784 family)
MANAQNHKITLGHKDTFFRTLFSDRKNFLELYNAVSNENLPDDTEVTPYPTNELLSKFNDLAAGIGNQLIVFFEHQSTPSPNMPLRLLSYVADILYLHLIDKAKLYGNERVMMPTPRFYILYNGQQKLSATELKLSDSFILKDSEPAMELTAKIVDINPSAGDTSLKKSETLKGYSFLIEEIRHNMRCGMIRDKAITTAMQLCIDKDILKEFLQNHYAEVLEMLDWEYDAETHMRVIAEESEQRGLQRGLQEGRQEGRQEGIDLLENLIKAGIPLDEALKQVKSSIQSIPPSQ